MADLKAIYLIVSGADGARSIPALIEALAEFNLPIYTMLTEAAKSIISPYNLADQQGHQLISGYFSPALLNGRVPGLTLVAPSTFNTLNKISQGIADTLPHSMIADAIGARWPVIVVPSMNSALANHPMTAQSIHTLRRWGVTVLDAHLEKELMVMASTEEIITAVKAGLAAG